MDPKIGTKTRKMEPTMDNFFVTLFVIFGVRFGSMLGTFLELKSAMMRQDGPKKDLKSLKVLKSSICE